MEGEAAHHFEVVLRVIFRRRNIGEREAGIHVSQLTAQSDMLSDHEVGAATEIGGEGEVVEARKTGWDGQKVEDAASGDAAMGESDERVNVRLKAAVAPFELGSEGDGVKVKVSQSDIADDGNVGLDTQALVEAVDLRLNADAGPEVVIERSLPAIGVNVVEIDGAEVGRDIFTQSCVADGEVELGSVVLR